MKSSVSKEFRKKLDQLPAAVQEQAARAYALWRKEDQIYWFWIGSHAEYDDLLKRI